MEYRSLPPIKILAFWILPLCFIIASTGIAAWPLNAFFKTTQSSIYFFFLYGLYGWFIYLMFIFSERWGKTQTRISILGLACFAIVVIIYLWTKYAQGGDHEIASTFFAGVLGLSLGVVTVILLLQRAFFIDIPSQQRSDARQLLLGGVFLLLYGATAETIIHLTVGLHPTTFDGTLYHFEATLGFFPSTLLGQLGHQLPWLKYIVTVVYDYFALEFAVLFGAQILRKHEPQVNILMAWLIAGIACLIGYHFLPATGPIYVFSSDFPFTMPSTEQVPSTPMLVMPSYRNAVPSMHFGWALLLWLNARMLQAPLLRAGFLLILVLNVIGTLMLGEHYLVDLIIAVPFIVSIQAFSMFRLGWANIHRRNAILGGLAVWLSWVLILRFGINIFKVVPGLSWAAMICTIWVSTRLYRPLVSDFIASWKPSAILATPKPESSSLWTREIKLIAAMFVTSGFAGLIYEVLFSKELALTFGSNAIATYTVLATYMGGMAIGAWLGGKIASSRNNALFLYAICEFGIGIYALATPFIFKWIQLIYINIATGFPPDATILLLFRLTLGALALALPTLLMGMTLPLLARFLESRSHTLGWSVAILYSANTIGAALGALLSGYLILPALGVNRTTLLASLLNLFVALLAIQLYKEGLPSIGTIIREQFQLPRSENKISKVSASEQRLGLLALIILGVGGIVTLAIEIKYMHLLAVIAGNSTFAFSLMLFSFLLGLGCGAEAIKHILNRISHGAVLLGWLEFGLAFVILAGVFFWEQLPDYFGLFADYPLRLGFGAREFIRGLVCLLLMFPPAFFIGAIYPVAMECIGRAHPFDSIRALGRAAALNTLGNIVGVLLGGFVLLPQLGALRSIQLLAIVCAVLGGIALALSPRKQKPHTWLPVIVVIFCLAIQPSSFNYTKLASGANVYFAPQGWGEVIDHAESIDGGLTSVASNNSMGQQILTLLTNGKFQGNNSRNGEMQAQLGFSLSPLLHTQARTRALIIGYGTGVSARTLRDAGFQHLDIVDISSDIIQLADKHFGDVNDRVTSSSGSQTFVTDGRNYLLLCGQKYDIIGLEISSIWFAGAASLYNREFYRLAKRKMHDHGVLQQWIQLHHLLPIDILYILGSVRAEFEYVWLYNIGSQGMIIATNDPTRSPSSENLDHLMATVSMQPLLGMLNHPPTELLNKQLLDPLGIDRLLNGFAVPATYWVSTDDNLFLEYSTPKGNVLDSVASYTRNLEFIKNKR